MQSESGTQNEGELAIPYLGLKDIVDMQPGAHMSCLLDWYLFYGNYTKVDLMVSPYPIPSHGIHVPLWSNPDQMAYMLSNVCRREEVTISISSYHSVPVLPVFHVTIADFYNASYGTRAVNETDERPQVALCRALLMAVAIGILRSTAPVTQG